MNQEGKQMSRSHGLLISVVIILVLGLAFSAQLQGASGVPMMRGVDKNEAMRGDEVTITGQNLGKAHIAEVYLTNGRDDIKVEIVEQTSASIKFRVGGDVSFGRYSLMILTSSEPPMFIEQPVRLSVVEKYTPKPVEPEPEVPTESTTAPSR